MTTSKEKTIEPVDLILRITLVNEDLEELNPSVWREFKVSAHVNLDLLHDKVIAPVMGWARNYHGYYMRPLQGYKKSTTYWQEKISAVDMWIPNSSHNIRQTEASESMTIGGLLLEPSDRLLYVYDLGDTWRHMITLKQRIVGAPYANGKIEILGGAMRCPNEDGGGCDTKHGRYQQEVLDWYNKSQLVPDNPRLARKLAVACFDAGRINALNVRGSFRCDEFDIDKRQQAVLDALRSRNSSWDSVKLFAVTSHPFLDIQKPIPTLSMARMGQQSVKVSLEDYRETGQMININPYEECRGREVGNMMTVTETVNVKPDPIESTLCCHCGNPLNLKQCSACKCARYCSGRYCTVHLIDFFVVLSDESNRLSLRVII